MNDQALAEAVVNKLLEHDQFSAWLGIELVEVAPGRAVVRMTTREEMLNGFGVCHGGIVYSLADSALAFASNTCGRVAVSIETGISHTAPIHPGDTLTAEAREETASMRLAYHAIRVTNQKSEVVGLFRGIVYRTGDRHFKS